MMINERHKYILSMLKDDPNITVKELSQKLFVSEPTVRRDLTHLHQKGLITKRYGGAILNAGRADREIPFSIRESRKSNVKDEMGARAASLISDGMVVMLDGSTSAYHIVPHLQKKKDLIVVTSGAKTAIALAEANIRTFSTGGQMIINSFSYVGKQAEDFVSNINADILFFSCHGLSDDGKMSDRSIDEANLRRAMFSSCKKKILLCDSSKFGKTYFYNIGSIKNVDGIISESELPKEIQEMIED